MACKRFAVEQIISKLGGRGGDPGLPIFRRDGAELEHSPTFSNCGLSGKGGFYVSHRAHGSLRDRHRLAVRPMTASGADVSECLLQGP